jgi:hypothetical protein
LNTLPPGYKVDPLTGVVTTPDGKHISPADLSSPAAMAAAGFTPSQISAMTAAQNQIKAAVNAATKGADANTDLFGDGGSGGKGGGGSVVAGVGVPGAGKPKSAINRNPSQVAGLTRNYNGEPIGVGSDSLFDMIDRRYQLHDSQGGFLNPAGGP